MNFSKSGVCVVFGGSGFIASHFLFAITSSKRFSRVVIADIVAPRSYPKIDGMTVDYLHLDVRTNPEAWKLPENVDLIANFAAVHREPGHELNEYYETNLPGADNICRYADIVGCNEIIFTSSIAPYGPSESVKTEESIPTPVSGYGGSKLAAEKIHLGWQRAGLDRKLVIVRPGVVFGPGEGGNVTRLVRATINRYFVYMGNRSTRKAGGYVKELVRSMFWVLDGIPAKGGTVLYNFTMQQAPTVEEYVNAVCRVSEIQRWVPSIPYSAILLAAYAIDFLTKPFGINQPVSPVRIKKLVRSNNIEPAVLRQRGYEYQYTLETAMIDWRRDSPEEWR